MSTEPLFDISQADFDAPMADLDLVKRINPHRGPMIQLSGVAWWTADEGIGWRDIGDDEFWVEGHIPGRPLFPGVLMIEAAAQLSSFVIQIPKLEEENPGFLGFVRSDETVFRGQVVPGDRMVLLAKLISQNRRRFVSRCQGFVRDALVFETTVTGMRF